MTSLTTGLILQRLILAALAVLILQTLLYAVAEERPTYRHPDIFNARYLQKKVTMPRVVNLNTASINELKTLPGIDESTALKIQRLRQTLGVIELADLQQLAGMPEQQKQRLMAGLQNHVTSSARYLRR